MRRILVLTTLLLMILGTTVKADTATLGSAADTYMRDATIRGGEVLMDIRGAGMDFAGYLRFDLSGLGPIVISDAQLTLTVSGGASRNDTMNTGRFSLYGLNDVAGNTPQNWDEATLVETGGNVPGAEWNGVVPLSLTGGRVTNLDAAENPGVTETGGGAGTAGTMMTVSGTAVIGFLQDRIYYGNRLATFIIGNDESTDRGYGLATKENATEAYRPRLVLTYTPITKAYLPNPAHLSSVPKSVTTVAWRNPDPNDPAQPNITSDVYFGSDANSLSLIANDTTETTATIPYPLAGSTTYYWRVDCTDPEAGLIVGNLWSFTASSAPEIAGNPADNSALENGSADFSASFTSDTAITSGWPKWYKTGDPAVELLDSAPDVAIVLTYDSGSGIYTSTLTLSSVETADDGTYFCEIKNIGGTAVSDSAKLIVKRLIAHWQLEGDAVDAVGTYTGTLGDEPVFAAGIIGQAMIFDGLNDYIDLPDGFSDFSAGLSMVVWANPSSALSWARFLDIGNGADSDNIYFARNGTTANLTFNVYKSSTGTMVTANNAIALNEWQMFVATLDDAGNVTLYKNGLQVQTGTIPEMPNIVTRTTNFIGDSNWGGDRLYAGMMDDVRVYNYALTADQIADLYQGVVGSYCRYKSVYDYDNDCLVTLPDLVLMAGSWLDCGLYPVTDCQ